MCVRSVLPTSGFSTRASKGVFDPFRNFAEEASSSGGKAAKKGKSKKETLANLFKPPVDLIEALPLEGAKEKGARQGKWILVNLQKVDEFACQVLNRDVWKCATVIDLIKDHFIFWQRQHNSGDGLRYIQLYPIDGFPHIGVLDPHTGQRMKIFSKEMTPQSFEDQAWEFLSGNKLVNNDPEPSSAEQIGSLGEDEQMALAIQASMAASRPKPPQARPVVEHVVDSDDTYSDDGTGDDNDTPPDTPEKVARPHNKLHKPLGATAPPSPFAKSRRGAAAPAMPGVGVKPEWKDVVSPAGDTTPAPQATAPPPPALPTSHLPAEPAKDCKEPQCTIRFTFPDNSKLQRRFLASEPLGRLLQFIHSHGFDHEQHNLVCAYPSRNLSKLDSRLTLESQGMKRETVHVQPK